MDPSLTPTIRESRPTCTLESLHTDALVAILSVSRSVADLHAFIHASPLVYKCFLSAKKIILLGIVSRDLGPVIRDVAALSRMKQLDWYMEGYHHQARNAMEECRQYLSDFEGVRGATLDEIIQIVRINRTTQFFVDLCAAPRLAAFRRVCPGASYGLSITERQRFSLALVHWQMLMRIYPGTYNPHRREDDNKSVVSKFTAILAAWEMEQMSGANAFLTSICYALFRFTEGTKAVVRPSPGPTNPDRGGQFWAKYGADIDALRRKIAQESTTNPTLLEQIDSYLSKTPHTASGGLDFLVAGHGQVRNASPDDQEVSWDRDREELELRERESPKIVAGNSADEPPYAWVDALDGLNVARWGSHLLPMPVPGVALRLRKEKMDARRRWRWMGFVFWDKDRVELLKREPTFSNFRTGWLTTYN